ncbi:uncharacterized protein [Kogia breviceps]|uniref:uncharacterized protein isoform X2 n=1 Tax=Kogia breviceps TaxID=27615 RepID=UPI0034D2EFF6
MRRKSATKRKDPLPTKAPVQPQRPPHGLWTHHRFCLEHLGGQTQLAVTPNVQKTKVTVQLPETCACGCGCADRHPSNTASEAGQPGPLNPGITTVQTPQGCVLIKCREARGCRRGGAQSRTGPLPGGAERSETAGRAVRVAVCTPGLARRGPGCLVCRTDRMEGVGGGSALTGMKKPSRVQDDRARAFLKVILSDSGRFKSAEGSGRDCCVASSRV